MLVKRFSGNPLISPTDVIPSRDDFEVVGVFNPAAVKYNDEVLLLLRIAEQPKSKSEYESIAPIYNRQTKQIDLIGDLYNFPKGSEEALTLSPPQDKPRFLGRGFNCKHAEFSTRIFLGTANPKTYQ